MKSNKNKSLGRSVLHVVATASSLVIVVLVSLYIHSITASPEIDDLFMPWYDDTPESFKKGLVKVVFIDSFNKWSMVSKSTDGMYVWPGKIYVVEGSPAYEVYLHELGHHVWYTKLNWFERRDYSKQYAGDDFRPTPYADTDASEDFAEQFRLWYANDTLQRHKGSLWRQMFFQNNIIPLTDRVI
ncbi:hypothetical protein GOV11_04850 [Candidatus Woesearchaeota archaeon]|nr:hypothetical protein [Candidatus Woesearchaeota archaeon]